MLRTCIALALAVATGLAETGSVAAGHHPDPAGDATGSAPDILAVTIEAGDEPLVAISIEFAAEPPLSTDGETWTDAVLICLTVDPETGDDGRPVRRASRLDVTSDYVIGAHGITLGTLSEEGGHLVVTDRPDELYWLVVDVAVEGAIVTWRLDRKLIGDPDTLALQVLAGVERAEATEEEVDVFPDEGEPLVMEALGG